MSKYLVRQMDMIDRWWYRPIPEDRQPGPDWRMWTLDKSRAERFATRAEAEQIAANVRAQNISVMSQSTQVEEVEE